MFNLRTLIMVFLVISTAAMANPFRPDNMTNDVKPKVLNRQPVVRAPPTPTLVDIIIIGQVRSAVFKGNKQIKLGEQINGFWLTEVNPNYVVLSKGQQQKRLYRPASAEVKITPAKED